MQARSKQDVSKMGLTTFLRKQGKSGMKPVLSNGHGNEPVLANGHGNETGLGKWSNLVRRTGCHCIPGK
jgi:hypothetical protein